LEDVPTAGAPLPPVLEVLALHPVDVLYVGAGGLGLLEDHLWEDLWLGHPGVLITETPCELISMS
jgi:hypothetical protein